LHSSGELVYAIKKMKFKNFFKIFLFLFSLTAIPSVFCFLFLGIYVFIACFLSALLFCFIVYCYSPTLLLMSYSAKEIPKEGHEGLYKIIQNLSTKTKLPAPKLYTVYEYKYQAFSVGTTNSNSAIVINQYILWQFHQSELKNMLAQELLNIQNRSTCLNSIIGFFVILLCHPISMLQKTKHAECAASLVGLCIAPLLVFLCYLSNTQLIPAYLEQRVEHLLKQV